MDQKTIFNEDIKEYPNQKGLSIFLRILAILFIVESIIYILRGGILWLDEGQFFNYSLLVYQGKIPYLDFWYNHPPLFLYVYGLPQYILGPNIYIAKFTSFLLTGLSLILVYRISKKLVNNLAGVIAIALIILNPYSIRYFNTVTLHSLATFLLLMSFYFIVSEPKTPFRVSLSVFFMTLAVGVRLSMGAALIALMIYLFITEHKRPVNIISGVVAGAITAGLLWGPFLFLAWEQTIYGNIGWYLTHTQNVFIWKWSEWTFLSLLGNKVDAITEIVRNYPAIVILLFSSSIFVFWIPQERINCKGINLLIRNFWLLLGTLFALLLTHILLASPAPSTYILYSLPVAVILIACCTTMIFFNFSNSEIRKLLIAIFIVLLVLTPISQDRREIIPKFSGISDLCYIEKVAGIIKEVTNKNDEILTFAQDSTAQAGRRIISGLEQTYFAYVPNWDRSKCEKYHLYNTEILLDYIRSKKAKAIVLTDLDYKTFSSSGRYEKAPQVWELIMQSINRNYNLMKEIDSQKSWVGKTYIYLPKTK